MGGNSRTSQEFQKYWLSLQTEARQCAEYLDKELVLPLSKEVVGAGETSVDGSSRRKITQQREGLRQEVLTKALKAHPDRQARPVTVFQNFDKLSGAWLLALPGPSTGLSTPVFSECMSSHLCLGSPALLAGGWVGKTVGRKGTCY